MGQWTEKNNNMKIDTVPSRLMPSSLMQVLKRRYLNTHMYSFPVVRASVWRAVCACLWGREMLCGTGLYCYASDIFILRIVEDQGAHMHLEDKHSFLYWGIKEDSVCWGADSFFNKFERLDNLGFGMGM